MALIECNFFSEVLGLATSMQVILPQRAAGAAAIQHPTLYLLHGLSDDHSGWTRRTSIERYVEPLGLAVVLPNVHRSYYTDVSRELRYWTFISQELPALARQFFPLSGERAHNFVACLSMGGYGAFKLALSHPESFAAAASLSGALDMATRVIQQNDPMHLFYRGIFGDPAKVRGSANDLRHLADGLLRSEKPRPLLYACCGLKDYLLQDNRAFRDHALGIGLDLRYEEDAGYEHTWDYWDLTLQRVLKWLLPCLRGRIHVQV